MVRKLLFRGSSGSNIAAAENPYKPLVIESSNLKLQVQHDPEAFPSVLCIAMAQSMLQ